MLALGWGGNDKMSNADIAGHAAAVLAAVTGNVGKPGAGIGVYVGQAYNSHAAALGAWPLPDDWTTAESPVSIYDMPYKENNCHALSSAATSLPSIWPIWAKRASGQTHWISSLRVTHTSPKAPSGLTISSMHFSLRIRRAVRQRQDGI